MVLRGSLAALAVAMVAAPTSAGSARPGAQVSARPSPIPIEPLWLRPGQPTGEILPYTVKRGDYLNGLGVSFKINPVRVTKPNARELRNGMAVGQVLNIDLRRITPEFDRRVSGLVLNLPEAHVYLVKRGKLVKDYPVGVSNAERKAPLGFSRVVSMVRNPAWHVPLSIQKEMAEQGREVKKVVPPGPENPLGSRWIGFSDGTYGFHGTTLPWSIKRYASHGCARFLREDIEDLFSRVRVGMPVRVVYQPVTLAVEGRSVWVSIYPDYYHLGYNHRAAVYALARAAKVSHLIREPALQQALRDKDGILVDVAAPPPTPRPTATPVPTPTPTPVATPTPVGTSTLLVPSDEPSASSMASPVLSATPALAPATPLPPSVLPTLSPLYRPPGFPFLPINSPPSPSNSGP